MISSLRGTIVDKSLNRVTIEVSGIGYNVIVSPELLGKFSIGTEISLFTSLVVREDAWTLYGFTVLESRDLFTQLQSVTGVGPKVAYSLLSYFATDDLCSAIARGDHALLEKVPGIGRKVASRIILELSEKMQGRLGASPSSGNVYREEVVEALMGLGFSKKESDLAFDKAIKGVEAKGDVSEILKASLLQARRG